MPVMLSGYAGRRPDDRKAVTEAIRGVLQTTKNEDLKRRCTTACLRGCNRGPHGDEEMDNKSGHLRRGLWHVLFVSHEIDKHAVLQIHAEARKP